MKLSKNETGFTLIEILVVVLIIGIIAALAIPNLLSAQKIAWGKTCAANCSSLYTAAKLYEVQNGGTAPTDIDKLTSAVSSDYEAVMTDIPDCPAGGSNTYSFTTGTIDVTCSDKTSKHP